MKRSLHFRLTLRKVWLSRDCLRTLNRGNLWEQVIRRVRSNFFQLLHKDCSRLRILALEGNQSIAVVKESGFVVKESMVAREGAVVMESVVVRDNDEW